jgi:polysaccharide export outer membrane protein
MKSKSMINCLKTSSVAALLTCLIFFSACSGSGGTVPSSTCPEPAGGAGDYIIGAGDSLQIFVWRHDELTSSVPVRPDGKISIPLVEDMIAVGKTPTILARDIEAQLAEYLRTPKVNIIVQNQGAGNQIQVIGNVREPQSLQFRKDLTLLDVIVAVGGLDDFAAGNRGKVVREINDELIECNVRIEDLVEDGDVQYNINIYPGDVIVVPQARF